MVPSFMMHMKTTISNTPTECAVMRCTVSLY